MRHGSESSERLAMSATPSRRAGFARDTPSQSSAVACRVSAPPAPETCTPRGAPEAAINRGAAHVCVPMGEGVRTSTCSVPSDATRLTTPSRHSNTNSMSIACSLLRTASPSIASTATIASAGCTGLKGCNGSPDLRKINDSASAGSAVLFPGIW